MKYALIALALIVGACTATENARLSVADNVFGVATSNECRAVRAMAIVEAGEKVYPEANWTLAKQAAQTMHDNRNSSAFDAFANLFAGHLYTAIGPIAAEKGIGIADTGAIGLARAGLEVLNRLPNSAFIINQVRAKVAVCEAG